jgi:hypothetical protein
VLTIPTLSVFLWNGVLGFLGVKIAERSVSPVRYDPAKLMSRAVLEMMLPN